MSFRMNVPGRRAVARPQLVAGRGLESGEERASAPGSDVAGYRVGAAEIAGPEKFRLDELIRIALRAMNDPREVVADPNALYSGALLKERTLIPEDDAELGELRFGDWLAQTASTQAVVGAGAKQSH